MLAEAALFAGALAALAAFLFRGSWALLVSTLELLELLIAVKLKARAVRNTDSGRWDTNDLFRDAVRQWPERPMIIMAGGSGESATFREMDERSNRAARWLRSEGAAPGATVSNAPQRV